ncbi:MAG: hypothetical protein KDN05_21775, partial [Verrucomicrobiae bacterium]|nr:hypothetical protein [Verrucomicrobiae bacterium]
MDPEQPDFAALPHMVRGDDSGTEGPVFRYRRLIAPGDLVYRVGLSENLAAWDWSGLRLEEIGTPSPSGDGLTEEVTVRIKPSSGPVPEKAFFRVHVLIPPTDSDNDGIPDEWELEEFGTIDEVSAATDDGGSGIPDLLKYAFGMDPDSPEPGRMPRIWMDSASPQPEPRFQYTRLLSPGLLVYQIGVSNDLEHWDWSGRQVIEVGNPTPLGDGRTETVTVALLPQEGEAVGGRFLRLRVLGGR